MLKAFLYLCVVTGMSFIEIDPSRSGTPVDVTTGDRKKAATRKADVWIEFGPTSKVSIAKILSSLDSKQFQFGVKRLMDIVGALTALLILSPLLICTALAVKMTSPGPVFFKQERWGKNLTKIKVYKFRTMYWAQCDITGVEQTRENDSRITRVGAILRTYNIDELPQLLNILRGDMSMVGPRCHAVGMKAAGVLYEQLVPEYHLRHLVKPGLTGLAQVRGLRGPTVRASKARARVAADLHYIENYSVLLDLKIILKTVMGSKGTFGF
ncbi:sugar transferase [Rhizobium sp. L1K21]|uniref:sugar transferase n=1 Tax=Rhizobium sp. L1K21 TaxID=2954933 RepID=UPI0020934FF4|nr:sugar transferase [Rhizobium sp. L1K21]MCO6187065.1 sugar transferase [Rhizobium sp. L1K21]